jgi:hypothetical protein
LVNWSALETAELPVGVTTVTSTVPANWAGLIAVIEPSGLALNWAATSPKSTSLAPPRLVPLMVTASPPAVLPEVTLRPATLGALAAAKEVAV